MIQTRHRQHVQYLLTFCAQLKQGESLCILHDPSTEDLARLFYDCSLLFTQIVTLICTPKAVRHGEEPSIEAAAAMLQSDVIICLCSFSLAHTKARLQATQHRSRFLSLPLYTWNLLEDEAIAVPYQDIAPQVRRVADLMTQGKTIRVLTGGNRYEMVLDIQGRTGNYCPGFVSKAGELGSPPDIECNVSPCETKSEGQVWVNGSITTPELGLLHSPVLLTVKEGKITCIDSESAPIVDTLTRILGPLDSLRRVLAECGIGFNPKATLTGNMLTDEGAAGCVHFGFGSNHTVGGLNMVDFHLDFVFNQASLIIDDALIVDRGELQ